MNPLMLIPALFFGAAIGGPIFVALDRAHHRRNGLAYQPAVEGYNDSYTAYARDSDRKINYGKPPTDPVPSSIPIGMLHLEANRKHPADDMDVNQ